MGEDSLRLVRKPKLSARAAQLGSCSFPWVVGGGGLNRCESEILVVNIMKEAKGEAEAEIPTDPCPISCLDTVVESTEEALQHTRTKQKKISLGSNNQDLESLFRRTISFSGFHANCYSLLYNYPNDVSDLTLAISLMTGSNTMSAYNVFTIG